jgi:imidazolonepropionase-like amidohydrolase
MTQSLEFSVRYRLTVIAIALLASLGLFASAAHAQQGPVNGIRPADLRAHAIVDATVIPRPGERIEHATILIRDGVIEAVGIGIDVPPDARIWPGEGLTIYPGLIDAALLISADDRNSSAGAHWNNRIRPEIVMAEQPAPSAAVRKQLRDLGFTVAAVYHNDGIFRGTGTVIALAEETEHVLSYRQRADMAAGFSYGGRRGGGYPGSLMGAIALMRQTLLDAAWHEQARAVYAEFPEGNEPPMRADALAAMADIVNGRQRVFFDASDEHNALRAGRIAREFDLDMMLLGSGFEFRRLDEIAALKMPIVVPVRYPERPNVNTLATADRTTLREMMTWEQAPTNARRLVEAGVPVALTTHRLSRRNSFPGAVRNAIRHGLSEDDALAALTTTPARLLGIDRVVGTIEPGKAANLVVVKGTLFDKDAKVRDTWINGRRHEISTEPDITFIGKGTLTTDHGHEFEIEFNTVRSRVSVRHDEKSVRARNVTVQRDQLSFILDGTPFDATGFVRFSGVLTNNSVTGSGVMPDGSVFSFTITATELETPDDEKAAPDQVVSDDAESDEAADDQISGEWRLSANVPGLDEPIPVVLTIARNADGFITGISSAMGFETEIRNASFSESAGELRYELDTPGGTALIVARITGDSMTGSLRGESMEGEFSGTRRASHRGDSDAPSDAPAKDEFVMPPDELNLPLGAFGLTQPLHPKSVIVHSATIWTAGPKGIIENGWMHLRDGKIVGIGSGGWPRIAVDVLIDATGKHITPGLIDCHSHTGINGGVNEFSHANTAEVRIRDVINPDDVNWYRQLAGGLTVANQLHGSANPIGGQNSVVKLKWGSSADEMLIDDAIEGIKFALGENVVRSQSRYPNTRMGVETMITDAFTAAREYRQEWERYNALSSEQMRRTMPPRRDLQLDALAEILEGDRLVHCHSYRQDEILMLIRVAERFGFTIGTFQHVLEGYKVAEAIAQHGAGASAFSDWWGFKVEVMDAIPYAGTLMHNVGVNVSFNSDSSELARRMNIEAAKAVRFGGLDPHEALKFVTINPAWQLRIDHRTGSLEEGKDADFVIWSGDPMSTYSRVEQTWIEGVKYFDLELDAEMRAHVERERQRLIQKILADAHGAPAEPKENEKQGDDASEAPAPSRLMGRLIENRRRMMEEQYRMGIDPEELRPGDCGCNNFWFDMLHFSSE